MKTSSKSTGKCQARIEVELDAEEAQALIAAVEKDFVREAQIPGFRKGKIPVEIVRKRFADGLKEETLSRLVRQRYPEAVKAEKIDEVALREVQDAKCTRDGASFAAVLDVKPVFKLPTYKGLKVESKDTTVSDADVDAQVESLRAAYATYEDAKEGDAVGEGDFVQIDYDGKVGKEPIAEAFPEAKMVASGRGFWTQALEGRFLPEILDALKGMKAGETKEDVAVKFAKEGAPEGLGGKKATYTVTLKAFRRRIMPDDAALAEKAGAESFEKCRANIRERMEKAAVEAEKSRRESQAVDLLMKKVDFDVPESAVERVKDGILAEYAQRAQYSGLDASYFEKNRDKIQKDAQEAAERQVRLWYVIDAIAEAEKIEASDKERGAKVVEFLLANAKN